MATIRGMVVTDERSHITSASAETVWRVWSDTTTWPKWNPDVRVIELNGFFDDGVKGTMTTSAGTYKVTLTDVVQEESFTLVMSLAPLTMCYIRCAIRPLPDGTTKLTQSIGMRGPLSVLVGPMLRPRVARGYGPLLKGLASRAEGIERRRGPQLAGAGDYAEQGAEQGANG